MIRAFTKGSYQLLILFKSTRHLIRVNPAKAGKMLRKGAPAYAGKNTIPETWELQVMCLDNFYYNVNNNDKYHFMKGIMT